MIIANKVTAIRGCIAHMITFVEFRSLPRMQGENIGNGVSQQQQAATGVTPTCIITVCEAL